MRHALCRLGLAGILAAALWPVTAWPSRADEPLPIIVTYEMRKARTEARAAARDPKAFWVGAIVGRIEDRKPLLHMALKAPVTVAVSFTVARDGRLVSSSVAKPSGDAAIDRRAVEVLASAAPFPPMPQGLTDDSLSFTVPLRFK
ncbi:protein of unknown function [Beijerinckiaceae bacterium RH AL1]|nr:energy transducer TonB [Beijerinckiaceae bacterium]VVB45198.1 protein of unknown function [Beijerinckiaceae bacterium RH CH11]VVB45276.1 protein of unknown function [Beijerinckiaceae bacterium RH AL8]VVC54745.1 protein of unknown function [Beijerinckiaceae bacterium RH AL1]